MRRGTEDHQLAEEIEEGGPCCPVVDPRRDIDEYAKEARRKGLRLRYVLETHSHNDFILGLLRQQGFTQVANVLGGMTAWRAAQYPTT